MKNTPLGSLFFVVCNIIISGNVEIIRMETIMINYKNFENNYNPIDIIISVMLLYSNENYIL